MTDTSLDERLAKIWRDTLDAPAMLHAAYSLGAKEMRERAAKVAEELSAYTKENASTRVWPSNIYEQVSLAYDFVGERIRSLDTEEGKELQAGLVGTSDHGRTEDAEAILAGQPATKSYLEKP